MFHIMHFQEKHKYRKYTCRCAATKELWFCGYKLLLNASKTHRYTASTPSINLNQDIQMLLNNSLRAWWNCAAGFLTKLPKSSGYNMHCEQSDFICCLGNESANVCPTGRWKCSAFITTHCNDRSSVHSLEKNSNILLHHGHYISV